MISVFLEGYGHDFYYNERWTTRDHIIPFRHFFMMLNALGHVHAAQQLRNVFATGHGISLVWKGKDGKVKRQTRNLIEGANPEAL